MRAVKTAAVAALALGLVAGPATGSERVKPTLSFFSGSQSHANWTPEDSSDANRMSIELKVGPTGYAGVDLQHVEGTPAPAREPYFYHKEDRGGPSGGSPRLVIIFGGIGNRIELRPDQWSTSWQRVGEGDGDGNWDVNGGICGFRYDVTYEEALACHPGAVVQDVILVSDSSWLYGTYTNWIDQLQYDSWEFSHASDNNNSQAGGSQP